MRPAAAYAVLYFCQFAFLGVQLPYFAKWLEGEGLTASAIGLLGGGALLLRLLLAPPLAFRAEGMADARTPTRLVSAALAGTALLLLTPLPTAGVVACAVMLLFLFGLAIPLADAAVLRVDRAGQAQFGRVRGVGSFAFIVGNVGGGMLIDATSYEASVWWMAASGVALAFATLLLPAPPPPDTEDRPTLAEAFVLFRSRSFVLMLFATGLIQGSHATLYTFSALHWPALGYSGSTIAWLWTVGVLVEIVVLYYGRALLTRIDPALLILIGGVTAVVRWPLTGLSPPLWCVVLLQLGHAGTFTATYLGSVEFVGRAVPQRYQATAMTLVSTLGVGAMTGVATALAGQVFVTERPVAAYALMAAMGAGGAVLALMLRRRWDGGTVSAVPAAA